MHRSRHRTLTDRKPSVSPGHSPQRVIEHTWPQVCDMSARLVFLTDVEARMTTVTLEKRQKKIAFIGRSEKRSERSHRSKGAIGKSQLRRAVPANLVATYRNALGPIHLIQVRYAAAPPWTVFSLLRETARRCIDPGYVSNFTQVARLDRKIVQDAFEDYQGSVLGQMFQAGPRWMQTCFWRQAASSSNMKTRRGWRRSMHRPFSPPRPYSIRSRLAPASIFGSVTCAGARWHASARASSMMHHPGQLTSMKPETLQAWSLILRPPCWVPSLAK